MSVELDFQLLFNARLDQLDENLRINLISQYRFLRALEMGFGVFALIFVRQIFSERQFNRLFLFIMAAGVLARLVSVLTEGRPNRLMLFFMFYELIGVAVIYLYTKLQVNLNGKTVSQTT